MQISIIAAEAADIAHAVSILLMQSADQRTVENSGQSVRKLSAPQTVQPAPGINAAPGNTREGYGKQSFLGPWLCVAQ